MIGRLTAATVAGAALLIGAVAAAQTTEPSDLTIVVENLRSAEGQVRLALWDKPEEFTKADAALIATGRPAAPGGRVRFDFPGLRPGRYAVATYHDENGNGKFDRTWLGLPKEGLGFSNGAWIGFGPPSFEEAAFEVGPEHRVIVITLRY
ncbi:MAG: DUF2141 domain-containing protein [Kiloniellaceae bacterium]